MKEKLQLIFDKYKNRLNIMKDNMSRWEEENWSYSDIQECDRMITSLASVLSDINKLLKDEDNH